MATPQWEALRQTWAEDEGALVDIRAPDATVDEWQRVIEALEARWPLALEADGDAVPIPSDRASLFDSADGRFKLLRVALTPLINLNAHLPNEEIEFDFDPNEVLDQGDLDAITEFVMVLGRTLRRTVHVLVEGGDLGRMDSILYDDATDEIVVPD